ncbi:MAG: response regulator transcription factor [Spirochaetales bacterium]|nr:response regulator transcription factor [Spirochaetales bacterium]
MSVGIFILDDHALMREGLKKIIGLEAEFRVTGEAGSGREALAKLNHCPCDILILDISLPDKGGLEILREVKTMKPGARILFFSVHPEEQYAVRVLDGGADGYLCKNSAAEELVPALKTVLTGKKYLSAAAAQELAARRGKRRAGPAHERLSPREFQILLLLGAGETVSRIARKLNLSVSTANTHRRHILMKLELKTNAALIRYVIEHHLSV